MVLADWQDVLGASVHEDADPLAGVEELGPPQRRQLRVAGVGAVVGLKKGLDGRVAALVVVPEPLVAKGWHGKHAPVDEDAQLHVGVPVRQRPRQDFGPCARSRALKVTRVGHREP